MKKNEKNEKKWKIMRPKCVLNADFKVPLASRNADFKVPLASRLSIIDYRLSIIDYRLSILDSRFSILDSRLSILDSRGLGSTGSGAALAGPRAPAASAFGRGRRRRWQLAPSAPAAWCLQRQQPAASAPAAQAQGNPDSGRCIIIASNWQCQKWHYDSLIGGNPGWRLFGQHRFQCRRMRGEQSWMTHWGYRFMTGHQINYSHLGRVALCRLPMQHFYILQSERSESTILSLRSGVSWQSLSADKAGEIQSYHLIQAPTPFLLDHPIITWSRSVHRQHLEPDCATGKRCIWRCHYSATQTQTLAHCRRIWPR